MSIGHGGYAANGSAYGDTLVANITSSPCRAAFLSSMGMYVNETAKLYWLEVTPLATMR